MGYVQVQLLTITPVLKNPTVTAYQQQILQRRIEAPALAQ